MTEKDVTASQPRPDEPVHEIDGIIELNHPAPMWWQTIYYASILWAIAYAGFYLSGTGNSIREDLVLDLARLERGKVVPTISADQEREELQKILADPEGRVRARAIFTKNCASCHADDGGGGIGPNLTDANWIHGDGSVAAILKVVRDGVSEKGMPPWGPILRREETLAAAAYVRSLRGGAVAKAKPPEGKTVTDTEEK